MLEVEQYDYIRTAYRVYGKKIRQIARETGHSRKTIRKVLQGQYMGYKSRAKQVYPILGCYLGIIDSWLEDDKNCPRKQRHTAIRVFHRLQQEHGFTGSEATVRRYVRETRIRLGIHKNSAVFIPCDALLGQEAEIDWGNCIAILDGKQTALKLFCMRSKGSGKHFVQCFPCERQQALFEGHIQGFAFFGGIFSVLIYDNLTTAVEKVLRGRDRRLQENFLKLKAYYSFTPRFCNPGQGHEKGGIEGLVGYARRNYMVPVPVADSLDQLNERLLIQCLNFGSHRTAGRDKTVGELYEQEKQFLLPLPNVPFSNIDTWSGKADKFSTVHVDKNRYSVPTENAGTKISAVKYIDRVELYYGGQKIAVHKRLFGNNKWQLDPMHYLALIHQRPQAFDSARPIRQWRKDWPQCLEELLKRFRQKQGDTKGTKEFILVLMLFKEHPKDDVIDAVEAALAANVSCSDAVVYLLQNAGKNSDPSIEPLGNWLRFEPADVSVYGQIGGGI
ncbi:MAG: IS21 family transposase [Deltaproteobacteria bacterium]|jgi:transposase|nr:IS21 family transposase [Deltaproteobacteria bacterium]